LIDSYKKRGISRQNLLTQFYTGDSCIKREISRQQASSHNYTGDSCKKSQTAYCKNIQVIYIRKVMLVIYCILKKNLLHEHSFFSSMSITDDAMK